MRPIKVLLVVLILAFLLASTAWRPLDGLPSTWSHSPSVLVTPVVKPTQLNVEITQQTGESNGIILAGVVIVLIILGGTFGATRRKEQ